MSEEELKDGRIVREFMGYTKNAEGELIIIPKDCKNDIPALAGRKQQ